MEKTSSSSVVLPEDENFLSCARSFTAPTVLCGNLSLRVYLPLNYLFPCGQKCIFHLCSRICRRNSCLHPNTCHSLGTGIILEPLWGLESALRLLALPAPGRLLCWNCLVVLLEPCSFFQLFWRSHPFNNATLLAPRPSADLDSLGWSQFHKAEFCSIKAICTTVFCVLTVIC